MGNAARRQEVFLAGLMVTFGPFLIAFLATMP